MENHRKHPKGARKPGQTEGECTPLLLGLFLASAHLATSGFKSSFWKCTKRSRFRASSRVALSHRAQGSLRCTCFSRSKSSIASS